MSTWLPEGHSWVTRGREVITRLPVSTRCHKSMKASLTPYRLGNNYDHIINYDQTIINIDYHKLVFIHLMLNI